MYICTRITSKVLFFAKLIFLLIVAHRIVINFSLDRR